MMRLATSLCAITLSLAASALACGDKFVFIGSGARLDGASLAKHPGRVFIFADPKTELSTIAADIQSGLRRAGHRVVRLDSEAALREALRSASPDLVLVDVDDIEKVSALLKDLPKKPGLLPVVYKKEQGRIDGLKAKYSCLVTPKKGHDVGLFALVNEAIETRARGGAEGCSPSV